MDEEKVVYSFEGNVSSLKAATEQALGLLSKYGASIQQASSQNVFNVSQKSSKSFNASINKMLKDVTALQAKLKGVGDVKIPGGGEASKALAGTLGTLQHQLERLNGVNPITTRNLTAMKQQLDATRTALSSTTPALDNLIAGEQRFQNILGVVQSKATQFNTAMTNTKQSIAGTFDPISQKLGSFSGLFSTVFSNVGAKMQSFKDKAQTAFSRVAQLSSTVASAFRRTSQDTDAASASANRASKAHRSLGDTLAFMKTRLTGETKAIQDEDSKLTKKNATLKSSESGHKSLMSAVASLGSKMSSEVTNISKFSDSLSKLTNVTGLVKTAISALTTLQLGEWLSKAANKSIEYVENLNLFTVAMGSTADAATEYVNKMSEMYGLDPSNIMRHAGYFYQLSDAIGMPTEASSILSLSLTKAANDIASLFNVDIEQVTENLASGMQGMSRAVRKYGIDIRNTTLQTYALQYGLTEQVGSMSEANRQALRYIAMIDQTSKATQQLTTNTNGTTQAVGDFAKTIESPANQLRIFKEQVSQLGRAIGDIFIRPLATALAYINGFIMALRTLISFITSLFGITSKGLGGTTDGFKKEAAAIGGVGSAAGGAAKDIKKLLAPFDELNILSEEAANSGGGGGGGISSDVLDPALLAAIKEMELRLEEIRMKAQDVRDAILEFLGFEIGENGILSWDSSKFEENLINKFPQWTKTIQAAFDHWGEIIEGFKAVFSAIGGVFERIVEKIKTALSKVFNDDSVSTWISNLGDNLQDLAGWIEEHEEFLANLAIAIPIVVTAIKGFQKVIPIISAVIKVFELLRPVFSALSGPLTTIAAIAGAIYLLYTNSESFAGSFDNLISTITTGFQSMWESIKPIFEALWEIVEGIWTDLIQPLLKIIGDALAPVLDTISEVLGSVFSKVSEIFGGIADIIGGVWDNILKPLISWLSSVLQPLFSSVFETIGGVVSSVFKSIGGVIDGLLGALGGVIDFLAGVFTGDWKRAWMGLVNIFVGIGNAIISVFETVINGIISIINIFIGAIISAVQAAVNVILGAVESIASWIGVDLDIRWKSPPPKISRLSIPRIPAMAEGGIITSPTLAMIGEGAYDEAVIPLGDSPQMAELAQTIAEAVKQSGGQSGGQDVNVKVIIGGKEWKTQVYQDAKDGATIVGATPVKVGG